MKEESKYYQPSIEEFCVGFEYQQILGTSWNIDTPENYTLDIKDKVFETIDFNTIDGLVGFDLVRVKYLDQSDLEELGYTLLDKKDPFGQLQFYKKTEVGFNCGYEVTITMPERCGKNAHYIGIEYEGYSHWENTNYKIRPIIKNKFELKRLLQQLRIL